MNKNERKQLTTAIGLIDNAIDIINNVIEQEEEKLSNLEEHFPETEMYEQCENAIDILTECVDDLATVTENINDVTA